TLLRASLAALPDGPRRMITWGIIGANVLTALAFAWKWTSLTSYASRDYDMWERVMTQGRVLWEYLGHILLPRPSSSALYNDGLVVSTSRLEPVATLPALLLAVGVTCAAVWWRKRAPLPAFAVLW